jgi:catechol 2,3-dioxygenase-like lactoylglutathione lyase family enzyme
MAIELETLTPLLGVYDMPTSVAFYRDMLGFTVVAHADEYALGRFHWAMLKNGTAALMLNTNYEDDAARPVPPDTVRTPGHGDTTIYINCPAVDAAAEELRAKGVAVRGPENTWYGARQIYMVDPDGYNVCLQWAAPPTETPTAPPNG